MRCFYHEDREAVGSCTSCGKGLCRECAVDLTKGLACRGRCEQDVSSVIALIDRNIKIAPRTSQILETSRKVRSNTAILNLVMGVLFIIWGFTNDRLSFIIVLGIAFLIFGVVGLFQARRFMNDTQEK
jgi:hypothetical protein